MQPGIFRYVAILLILCARSLAEADGWAQLKIGMSTNEAADVLGIPLIRTAANGFEVWIYDNRAEAVFYGGPLVGWTTPTRGKIAGQASDVWQRKPDQNVASTFILPRFRPRNKIGERRVEGEVYSLPYYRVGN